MPISDWPTHERPREKLLSKGPAALSDAEILSIFLRTGRRGSTAMDLARELLQEYGGLRPLIDAGLNRVSMGVQSFSKEILRKVFRRPTSMEQANWNSRS